LRTGLTLTCATFALLLISTTDAPARQMHVEASTPLAEAIMQGRNEQFAVRFDGPVNHARSHLEILRDGQVVRQLHPLLDSAPDVLFASAPAPQPGHYVLRWSAYSLPDGEMTEGTIPFTVEQ
jgi:methionine-rich copper-binding protein CopC